MSAPDQPNSNSTGRSQNEFVSIDSAPVGFSTNVAMWRAPVLLVLFVLVSFAGLYALEHVALFQTVFRGGDLVTAPFAGGHSMPLRLFVLSYMIAFGLLSNGPLLWRLGFTADMAITYLAFCALIDVTALLFDLLADTPMPLNVIEILSGFLGYAIYSFKLLERGNMPSRIEIEHRPSRNKRMMFRLIVILLVAGLLTISAENIVPNTIAKAREYALLGGIGPGVFLFLPLVFLMLYVLARIDTSRVDMTPFTPALTIIIPAHNEEYIITRTIAAIDEAARTYGGPVSVLVMDNNSTDRTSEVATDALNACKSAYGRVILERTPGKAHALNAALHATQTEYVIRIDADTQIGENALVYAMLRMRNPDVGVVGGLPVPPGGGPFDRPRLLELVVKHGFYSVGLSAVNSVVGVPGMFAAYRAELPRKLGGFVQGMNGEDTDMSLRIGELGYQLIVDPRIQFVSEVPASYKHMREQRLRWFRSVFHVSARCRDLIYSGRMTVRGKVLLPFMLLNSAMRAMMVPMILFGTLVAIGPGAEARDIPWQAIVAVGIGAPALMSVLCALLNRSFKGLLFIPEYLVFRLLRAYFTLESNLTITVKDHGQHLYSSGALVRPKGKTIREA
ncbi:Poly-beta-1,6-N-acetyl-D-glucosamine synthase [Falsiruegeria litorea R37]|uniref:Poly-beta-1,6-N-acetyl-D-glucosamine synthase n=1 Tax=Falsiruegeria litorea R37 TaxID=1200284 RepID=A0A1Y5S292_9RHOB|nr:glycosyltransferase [Falsiruegeria litorea]SLN30954.1 Poly-beta-1,6-N-acetyl-D-glucosamine synthase [Falsiruegeria litorea R37]